MNGFRTFTAIAIVALNLMACGREEVVEPLPGVRVRLLTSDSVDEFWRVQGDAVLQRLQRDFGADATRVSVRNSAEGRAALRAFGEQEVDLVLCIGQAFEREVFILAQRYPSTAFVLSPGTVTAANVAVLEFQPFGAAYIGGVVAAIEGGRRVGLLDGEGAPWLPTIAAGFTDGFRSRFPSGKIHRGVGLDAVGQMTEASVGVALYAADPLDPAIMEAAEAADLRLVGLGSNTLQEYPDTVIAALSVDLPEAVERIFRDVLDGTFRGRIYSFDLGSGVVDLAISPGLQTGWGEDDLERVNEARAAVNAGLVELEHMGL